MLGAPTNSRDANTGVRQDRTGLAAVVQLHLRVASGLQALQRCSGLLNRRARGSTVATHHFEGRKRIEESHEEFDSLRAQQRVPAFCNLPSSRS
jgi:hypothetical protein